MSFCCDFSIGFFCFLGVDSIGRPSQSRDATGLLSLGALFLGGDFALDLLFASSFSCSVLLELSILPRVDLTTILISSSSLFFFVFELYCLLLGDLNLICISSSELLTLVCSLVLTLFWFFFRGVMVSLFSPLETFYRWLSGTPLFGADLSLSCSAASRLGGKTLTDYSFFNLSVFLILAD